MSDWSGEDCVAGRDDPNQGRSTATFRFGARPDEEFEGESEGDRWEITEAGAALDLTYSLVLSLIPAVLPSD